MSFVLLVLARGALPQRQAATSAPEKQIAAQADVVPVARADSDGVYHPGPGVILPSIVDSAPVIYPAPDPNKESERRLRHVPVISALIAADGTVQRTDVDYSQGGGYDSAAVASVNKSKFKPGTVDGKPVPVLIRIEVVFASDGQGLIKVEPQGSGMGTGPREQAKRVTPPKVLVYKNAQYSVLARKMKITGVVILTLVVDAQGLPTDLEVVKGLGYGLDEEAIKAVRQDRFTPGMRDGKTVPVKISFQVRFLLY